MRYFLIDKISHFEAGKTATGIKCISLADDVFNDHFPDYPILPGALIIEAMAQLSGFLAEMSINTDPSQVVRRALLAQVDKVKFIEPCHPGECLTLQAELVSLNKDAARITIDAGVAQQRKAQGTLSMVLHTNNTDKLHNHRRDLYRIWTRELANCPTIP